MTALTHSAHDFQALVAAWERTSAELGLRLGIVHEADGRPVLVVENELSAAGRQGGLYLSAGVHGDECAPVWALLQWAASAPPALRQRPVLLLPCLNPFGFEQNLRLDACGVDLNRSFADESHPLVGAWRSLLAGRRFDLAASLHEDYDARGVYLYELSRGEPQGAGFLTACEDILPRETAEFIDGMPFVDGLARRDGEISDLVSERLGGGWPESIVLFLDFAETALTFETPSEADLGLRIAAHRAFLDALAESRLFTCPPPPA